MDKDWLFLFKHFLKTTKWLNEHPDATGLFLAMLAMAALKVEDKNWNETMVSSQRPCGNEGCDCEKDRSKFFEAINEARIFAKAQPMMDKALILATMKAELSEYEPKE
jgi:hypothetical protein